MPLDFTHDGRLADQSTTPLRSIFLYLRTVSSEDIMSPTSSATILIDTARANLFNFVALPLEVKKIRGPAGVNRLDVRIMVGWW
jgi:hypothetical protein